MDPESPKKSLLSNPILAIAILPLALGFLIAAALSAGPSEVFKVLTGRK
jgi:hypothetical protein